MSQHQSDCFDQNKKFSAAVACTKIRAEHDEFGDFSKDTEAYAELNNYLDLISLQVKKGKVSPEEGRLLIADKIHTMQRELDTLDEQQSIRNQMMFQRNNSVQYRAPRMCPLGTLAC